MELHAVTNYQTDRYDYIKSEEAEPTDSNGHVYAYADGGGIAHIGIGLNLQVHLNLVLSDLGFDVSRALLVDNPTALAAEIRYINEITSLINDPESFLPGYGVTNDTRSQLNDILSRRSADVENAYEGVTNLTRVEDFAFATTVQSQQAFNDVLVGYTNPATGLHVEGYEQKLDRWLRVNSITTIPNEGSDLVNTPVVIQGSKERLALLSLGYTSKTFPTPNLPKLWGPNLTAALKNDDRAEVWYQIRYDSNAGGGHTSRRYREAGMFGLSDAGILGDEDYKSVYRMFTRHKDDTINGNAGMEAYDTANSDKIVSAYGVTVQPIEQELNPAATYLVDKYGLGQGISWKNIVVGEDYSTRYLNGTDEDTITGSGSSDLIFGESGNDTINAGNGDDVIYGGTGNDLLKGGTGNDYYVHNTGDGFDTIIDSDGTGNILFNGIKLNGGYQINPTTFRSNDQRFVYRLNTDGSLSITDTRNPTSGITVENFSDGNLNLEFVDYSGGVQNVAPFFFHENATPGAPNSGTRHNQITLPGTEGDDRKDPNNPLAHPLLASPVTTFINGARRRAGVGPS